MYTFLCCIIKCIHDQNLYTDRSFYDFKYNRRKYHGGHAPEMSEYEHILVEKQEIEELEYE